MSSLFLELGSGIFASLATGRTTSLFTCITCSVAMDMKNTSSTRRISIIGAIWNSGSSSGRARVAFLTCCACDWWAISPFTS